MTTSTHFLSRTARKMGMSYSFVDEGQSVLILHFPKKDHFIVNTKLGLITNAEETLGIDKAYQYQLLKDTCPIPKTKSYLDIHSKYGKFAKFHSLEEIRQDIQESFSFPLVVKKNSGNEGMNVFLVSSKEELKEKTEKIFDLHDSEYDFVLIAQKYIRPTIEYRVIIYNQKLVFAYIKDNSEATFTGNLSPLHWEKAKTIEVTDPLKLERLDKVCQQVFSVWPLQYGGLDIIEDTNGKTWLIEINTSPSLAFFIKDNGERKVVELYEQILSDLRERNSK